MNHTGSDGKRWDWTESSGTHNWHESGGCVLARVAISHLLGFRHCRVTFVRAQPLIALYGQRVR